MTDRRGAPSPDPGLGARLRRLREAAGLSQVALAGDDLSPSYVSLLEAGRRHPTADVVALLAARLGVTPDELAGTSTVDLEEPVVLAEAALGLGRPADAVDVLAAYADRFTLAACARDPLIFRAGHAHATALERTLRVEEAVALYETLRGAAEQTRATVPWIPVTTALVRCYRNSGDVSRAVEVGETTLAELHGLVPAGVEGHAALVSTVAGAYSERGDLLRAQLLLDGLLDTTASSGSTDDRAFAFWNAAINAVERGRAGEGLRLADEARALLEAGDDLRARARLHITRAWVHLAQDPPEPTQARALLRAALPAVRQHAGAHDVASAETELARCELLLGRPEVARRHAAAALKRLPADSRIERARALAAHGSALLALDEEAAGVLSLDEAAAELEASEAPRAAAAVWRQLSSVYRALGDPGRALDAADRALEGVGLAAEPLVPPTSPAAARPRARSRASREPRRLERAPNL